MLAYLILSLCLIALVLSTISVSYMVYEVLSPANLNFKETSYNNKHY
jgi:hypothetical protein